MGSDTLYPYRASTRQHPLGTCIGGVSEIDYALTKVTGRTALAHRLLRRLITPRGGVWYAPTYGYDLTELIGSTVPTSVIEQRVEEQMYAEEEVSDAAATAVLTSSALTVDVNVVDADGPFKLVLSQSELTVTALLDGVKFFEEEVT